MATIILLEDDAESVLVDDPRRANHGGAPHHQHRRRIPHPAGLDVAKDRLEPIVGHGERHLEVDANLGHQVLGPEARGGDFVEPTGKVLDAVGADGDARR